MVLSLKLGALVVLSTVGTLWHTMAPSGVHPEATRDATAISCAPRFGVSSAKAEQFLEQLQGSPVDIDKALFTKSPVFMMLQAVPKQNRSSFEDCAGLEPGFLTMIAGARTRSSYRSFLQGCMRCAGDAFRVSGEVWPTEGVLFDMIEIISSNWLASTTHLVGYAAKYKPVISALPAAGRTGFSECMAGVQGLPGAPMGLKGRRRLLTKPAISQFETVIADVSGHAVPSAKNARVASPGGGGASRRLMKGGFFYGSFSEGQEVDACFGQDGTVVSALSDEQMRIGDVKVGDVLTTTVEHDKVVFVHTVESKVPMIKLVLEQTSIEMTPNHLVSTLTGMRPAGALKLHDSVWVQQDSQTVLSKVLEIHMMKGLVIAPITESGTLVVNGVVASCYAHGSHHIFHLILAPYRALFNTSPELAVRFAQFGHQVFFEQLLVLAPQHMTAVLTLSFASTLALLLLPFVAAGITAQRLHRSVVAN